MEGEAWDVLSAWVRVGLKQLIEASLLESFHVILCKVALSLSIGKLELVEEELILTREDNKSVVVVELGFPDLVR